MKSELGQFPGRDPVRPQAGVECAHDVYRQAGIGVPRQEIDVAEIYVPFSWYEPMWLEGHDIAGPGEGWKMVESGDTELTGSFPVNASGGVLSSNPIGASGMLRFAEAALQVRGLAGEHQVDGARTALAQAYGGAAQYFAMGILRSDPRLTPEVQTLRRQFPPTKHPRNCGGTAPGAAKSPTVVGNLGGLGWGE